MIPLLMSIPSYLSSLVSVQDLTLEEKVGQLFMVHFHGESPNEEAKILIQEAGVGGIIYYNWSNGLTSPEQVKTLSLGLQALAPIPLFLAIDQEGGLVTRCREGFTEFPGNGALGATRDSLFAHGAASAIGEELRAVGINLNFAPVVDVNSNPCNPIIGVRSFGNDPKLVADLGKASLEGFKKSGILTTLKHFPGHGDVEIDSHERLPIVKKTLTELEQVELLPFRRLTPFADLVMTAHLLIPALDEEHCSTLSKKTLDYLRNILHFDGVIVSDSLIMEGVLKECHQIEEATIQAFLAGCDLLLLGGKCLLGEKVGFELQVNDVLRIKKAFLAAIQQGRISEEKLNASVKRILHLKERLQPISERFPPCSHTLAKKIASLALRIQKKGSSPSFKGKKVLFLAPRLLDTKLPFLENRVSFFESLDLSSKKVQEADLFCVFSYQAWKDPEQKALIDALCGMEKPLFLIATRDPQDADLFPLACLTVQTFSPEAVSLQAALEAAFSISDTSLSSEEIHRIGEKIWQNECGGKKEHLVHWNVGEDFPSLGIGHFIWYPHERKEHFEETFPSLLSYLQKNGVKLPPFLSSHICCPWSSKDIFDSHKDDEEMKTLRSFLFETKDQQMLFIISRFTHTLPRILSQCPKEEQERIEEVVSCLMKDPRGVYALIDYLNFKGAGTSPLETYQGKGWGLLQVLQKLPTSSSDPIREFVKIAKAVLAERVRLSPPERNEQRWLPGWCNRLDTYTNW